MTPPDFDASRALRAWGEDLAAFGLEELTIEGGGRAPAAPESGRQPRPFAPLVSAGTPGTPPTVASKGDSGPGAPAPDRSPPSVRSPAPAPAPAPAPVGSEPILPGDSLERIAAEAAQCVRCGLAATRHKVVPGQGNPKARLFFAGEAPGADEDRSGLAFVGQAGQLLTRMILAMGLQREDVFIANVLKCRPPMNRNPEPHEAAACLPFLKRQIEIVRPELVICLGRHAAHNLLATEASIRSLRGRVHACSGIKVVVTYHPSYLLQNPEFKKDAWDDLKLALKLLDLEAPKRAEPS